MIILQELSIECDKLKDDLKFKYQNLGVNDDEGLQREIDIFNKLKKSGRPLTNEEIDRY
jgi:hypothetical protein